MHVKTWLKYLAKHQKKWFGQWHAYAGILAGAVLFVVSTTGFLLVFEQELDVDLNPTLFPFENSKDKSDVGFSFVLDKAESYLKENASDWRVEFIYQDPYRENAYLVYIENEQEDLEQLVVNPHNGEITGRRDYDRTFTGFVRNLHRTLLIPGLGRYLVGSSALMGLVLVVTGLRLWWPKKWAQLKSKLWLKTKAKRKRVNYDLHSVLGLYFSPFISIISTTGAIITFNQFVILMLFLLSFSPPQSIQEILGKQSTYREGAQTLSLQEVLENVQDFKPAGNIMGIALPHDSLGAYSFDVLEPLDYHAEGHRSRLTLDQYSGEILMDTDRDYPETARLYLDWVTPLHFGTFGGFTTRIVALFSCLAFSILFITGIYIWLPRWTKRKSKNQDLELSLEG
ncbi:PepSY domain-containing protein [Marinilongibacter aquaticus]|uniref:PepSY-associated TM helix domain-containing protein n=1 Tax=Marinilongibacter aquaticus TaxID=2975157 RepID=UPI0021BDD3E0|nr:PepSY-associated TM helix domain-containing protein [Marinilongibacter aquaticus]UBM60424.1 PepSY domain-containing protein [Marinilongibacter aquaticus]